VEQATATTPTAPTPRSTFEYAQTIAGALVPQLEQQPLAVEFDQDQSSGWRVHLKYGEMHPVGLLEFAALIDVPVTTAVTELGVHLDAIALVKDVEVRASALVSPAESARLQGEPAPAPAPFAVDASAPVVQPAPRGTGLLAELPAIVPVLPVPAVHLGGGKHAARPDRDPVPDTDVLQQPVTDDEQPPAPLPAQRLGSPFMGRIAVTPATGGQA
jgi:hypothetical protein